MRWQQGRSTIDGLLSRGELERVSPNREHADVLIGQAGLHIVAAKSIVEQDAVGAFQLLYDAARKSLCAVLENQGLRGTSRGGHIAVAEAVCAQLDPPLGPIVRPFDRMRRRRNDAEYPRPDVPGFIAADVLADVEKVERIRDAAARVLDEMSAY